MSEDGTEINRPSAVIQYILKKIADSDKWSVPFFNYIELPSFLSTHALMLLLGAGFLFLLFGALYNKSAMVPTGITNALEAFVIFIRDDVSISALGEEDGRKMAPIFLTFFFYILILNIMGLIPLFAGATGNVNVTAGLALGTLFFMVFGAIYKNGFVGFLKAFIPHGVPVPILFILAPIEFVSLLIKTTALTIRLFANMMAGSIVLYALIGLIVMFGMPALPGLLLAILIFLLKIIVAFLQAYIFTMLSAIFIAQVVHPEH
jgi:F-type H+-transporting ATPase subunit a